MADKEPFGISEQLDCSDCVNHGGDWDCDHVQCRKGADTISRAAAINAVHRNYDTILDFRSDGETVANSVEDILSALPPAQSSLYGYDLRNLIVFADAVNKKGISDSEIEDFVRNARAAWEYAWEEFQRTQKEALDSIMRGDHHDD